MANNQETSYFKIGAFVLVGLGLIIFALLIGKGLIFPYKVYNNEKVSMVNFGSFLRRSHHPADDGLIG